MNLKSILTWVHAVVGIFFSQSRENDLILGTKIKLSFPALSLEDRGWICQQGRR